MQRSRLKNIVNKSKEISRSVGDSFDQFKKTLPKEIDSNYRLKAAWKAYGSPKNYKEAIWFGMIQPTGENDYKLPSIGYNEETNEYEYLNSGKDNELVAKDIRVWDNDVIPFVQELKQGGFIRTFNEEKNCWIYSKNKEEINLFKKGGKAKSYKEWVKDIDFELDDDYDLETAYNELPIEQLDAWKYSKGETHLDGKYKKENHPTYSDDGYGWIGSDKIGWTFYVSPRQQNLRSFDWYKQYWDKKEPKSTLNYNGQIYKASPQVFKSGGQMNLIPEGALHAHKNHMELAKEGEVTSKGVPVVDNTGTQQAEIERNEIILNLSTTEKIEKYYKEYNEEESQSKKDEIAIKCGQMLAKSIIEDTDDKTGLIEEVVNKN